MNEPHSPGPSLSLSPELKPVYVNLVRIGHTPMELTFDFACLLPGQDPTPIQSRLVMSPVGAKLFLRALADNLARYEAAFGEVRLPGDPNLAGDLFRGVQPPDQA
jgi:hypothetical protein